MKKFLIYLSMLGIVLSCAKDDTYDIKITVNSGTGGLVSGISSAPRESLTLNVNNAGPLTVTAHPGSEYVFVGWTGVVASTDNPLTFEPQRGFNDTPTITALFELKQYALSVNVVGEGSVLEQVVSTGKNTTYESGTVVRLTAVPANEWVFAGWTGAIESSDISVDLPMSEAKEVTANFEKRKYPLAVNIVGEGSVTEEIISTGKATDYESGTTVRLTAIPDPESLFVGWSGAVTSTDTSVDLTILEAESVTATFVKVQYGLTIEVVGEGAVTQVSTEPNPGTDGNATLYDSGSVVTLTAVAEPGWEFSAWSGGPVGSEASIDVVITESSTITATFSNVPSFVVLDSNGVTLKVKENATAGQTGVIDGVTYTIVDAATLTQMITNDDDVTKVVTSLITDMKDMFKQKSSFNQDISSWDTSNVTTMENMFSGASSFDQDISAWSTSNVVNMGGMFQNASSFNQNIGGWITTSLKQAYNVFRGAAAFNQDISSWDMSSVTNMNNMFNAAVTFNQDISAWDVTSIPDATKMAGVFNGATAFNQDLNNWCVRKIATQPLSFSTNSGLDSSDEPNWGSCPGDPVVESNVYLDENGITVKATADAAVGDTGVINGITYTVVDAATLSQMVTNGDDVSNVVTTKITTLTTLFKDNATFNQDISSWDTSNVVNIGGLFQNAPAFNQDIGAWDTSSVRQAYNTFRGARNFNQDISSWNTGSMVNMNNFFFNAQAFNQDLTGWCVTNISSKPTNFNSNSALPDASLPVWGSCPD